MERPYISFVIPCRNDGYAGNFIEKLEWSLGVMLDQLEERAIPAEVLLVDWNPPLDRPAIVEVLGGVFRGRITPGRCITVPMQYHNRLTHSDVISLPVVHAVNVGVRRARGEFVLPRASDVFYSEPLMNWIAQRRLKGDLAYRCQRNDVRIIGGNRGAGRRELFGILENSIVHRHEPLPGPDYPPYIPLFENASGDFLLASRESWAAVRGIRESPDAVSFDHDGLLLQAWLAAGVRVVRLPPDSVVFKVSHGDHTRLKVTDEPLPVSVVEFENELVERVREFVTRAVGSDVFDRHVVSIADVVRFWTRLILDLPRRRVREGTVLNHATFYDFLNRAYMVARCAAPHDLRIKTSMSIKRRLAKYLIALTALRMYPGYRLRDAETFSARKVLVRLCEIGAVWLSRKPYRNRSDWGLGGVKLPEQQAGGERH